MSCQQKQKLTVFETYNYHQIWKFYLNLTQFCLLPKDTDAPWNCNRFRGYKQKKYGKHMPPHTSRKILRSLLAELKWLGDSYLCFLYFLAMYVFL